MARTQLTAALTTLASSIAKAFRSPTKLQAPEQRKTLFEAMEQRFLLSAEGIVPPPPSSQPLPALEAPLNTEAPILQPGLGASSVPVQYTIQGDDGQGTDRNMASALQSAAADPGGVTATVPTIVAVDPTLPDDGTGSTLSEPAAAPTATVDPADAPVTVAVATQDDGLSPQLLVEVAGSAADAEAAQRISLAAYAEFVQSRPAPAQLVIVDSAVTNYEQLVRNLASYGASEATSLAARASNADAAGNSDTQPAASGQASLPTIGADLVDAGDSSSSVAPQLTVSRFGDIEVVVLDHRYDGIDQMTDVLAAHYGLAAVQVLSHGASGTLRLGSSQFNDGRLEQEKTRVANWGKALRPGGDILLYGCDVAKGVEGMAFVDNLAQLTGADVAASTDATGSAARGGDWTLEYSTGTIESAPLFEAVELAGYEDVLTGLTPVVSGTTATFTGSAGADILHLRVSDSGDLEYQWDGSVVYTVLGGFTLAGGTISVDLLGGNDSLVFTDNATTGIKLGAASLTILGGGGSDSVTVSEEMVLSGGLSISAETIAISSRINAGTGSIVLTANAVDNSTLGNAQASITLDGADLSAASINLTATSSVTASSTLNFGPLAAALINVTSNAEVVIKNAAKLTTTGDLSVLADSTTDTSATSNAVGIATVASADAAVATSIVSSATKINVTGTTVLSVGGALDLSAVNKRSVTTVADGSAGGATAAGGSVAVATVTGDTEAYIDGGVTITAGSIKVSASKVDNITTSAKSTSGGSTSGGGTTQTETTLASNKAETSSGSVTIAGAVAVTSLTSDSLAYVNTTGTVTSTGLLQIQALNNSDASATADGSSIGSGAVGVGVAVAINNARTHNDAYLGGTGAGLITAGSISVEAGMASETVVPAATPTQTFAAQATSGAGGGVAVAGSLALSVADTTSTALIRSGTTLDLPAGGAVSLTAENNTSASAIAEPTGIGAVSASSVGVGASVALNIVNNTTVAEVANGVVITNAGDLTLSATSDNTAITSAKAGGTAGGSGVGVGGALGTAVVNNTTTADIGTGSALALGGALSVTATHRGATTTTADGTAGGGKAGVGIVLGLNVVNDLTTATTNRTLTVAGDASFSAFNSASSSVETKASAAGAEEEEAAAPADSKGFNADTAGVVDVDANTIDLGAGHELTNGQAVVYHKGAGGTEIGGLTDGSTYYVILSGTDKVKLATSALCEASHKADYAQSSIM